MAPKDDLLNKFSLQKQTMNEALSILRLAQSKTGAGSGRDIGSLSVGLHAACAYLASQKCNTTEVTKHAAQIASCLKSSDFLRVVQTVKAVIDEAEDSAPCILSLKSLHRKYGIEVAYDRLDPWFTRAGNSLLQVDAGYKSDRAEVRYGVFFWVCTVIKAKTLPTSKKAFAEENEVAYKGFTIILGQLNSKCVSMKEQIIEDMKRPTSPTKTPAVTTPRRSPVKRQLRELPSRGSPKKQPVAAAPSQPREEDAAAEDMLPETPTKKRKLDSPSKPPTKMFIASTPSSSRVTPNEPVPKRTLRSATSSPVKAPEQALPVQSSVTAMDVDVPADAPSSSESEEEAPPPLRRFRPIYLDRKQWYTRDPRLPRIWKQSERHKQRMGDLYGHLFEQYSSAV